LKFSIARNVWIPYNTSSSSSTSPSLSFSLRISSLLNFRQCDDIGRVKLPRWIKNYTGKQLNFEFTSGGEFFEDLTKYKLIVHCGGCMLPEREIKFRMKCAEDQRIPITNYGTLIAYMQGILKRSLEPFPYILAEIEE
jgi:hypothetical protein